MHHRSLLLVAITQIVPHRLLVSSILVAGVVFIPWYIAILTFLIISSIF